MPPPETWGSDNGGNSYGSTSIRKSCELEKAVNLQFPEKIAVTKAWWKRLESNEILHLDHSIHSDRGAPIVDQGSLKNESYRFQHKAL
ncbi:hypothetical protein Q31a_48730 [Aureliella helgolandensis]|uniref:Uncharacterized protein n=1 Tax=Aureliella helgolandensis TaxID=2527968 RepID=A0A518GD21_9BACT|nr:hypothetical protein Q31a_48730 [Aureliella helgolandensis]